MNKTQKNQRFLVSQRPKSFRKLIYIFVILVVGLFVVSACEEIVGRRITNNADGNGEGFQRAVADQGARNAAEGVSGGQKLSAKLECDDNGGKGFDYADGKHFDYECTVTCEDGQTYKIRGDSEFGEPAADINDARAGCNKRGSY